MTRTAQLVRFGPFELDLCAGELRKHGIRIRLRDQSFQILVMLLERPGEPVLRTDIREKLWPGDTQVEFDRSINSAVAALRTALNEAAEEPIYVETLPKRGYRFLAAVEWTCKSGPAPQPDASLIATPPAPETIATSGPSATQPPHHRPPPPRLRWSWLVAGSAAVMLALGAAAFRWNAGPPNLVLSRPMPITTFPGLSTFAALSPDGEKVAFSWVGADPNRKGNLNIYIKPVGNGDPVPITTGPWDNRLPQWSPDGSQIAFQRFIKPGHELMIVPTSGGAEREIAPMGVGLAWSPDGKEIAYVAPYPPEGSGGVVVRSLVTGQVRELTNPKPFSDGLVAWSPDGTQIAFGRSLTQTAQELFVIPSRGGAARRLTFDKQPMEGFAWTPDSRSLVFVSYRDGGPALWRISARGGIPERTNSMAHHPSYPAVALRANRLAFTESFGNSNVWQYERTGAAKGSEPALFQAPKCLICSTVEDDSPKFSPDGRKIVFTSKRTGVSELWLADSDGSYPIQLTSLGNAGSPRWSPDGRWIAFDSTATGSPEVFIVSAQGGAPHRLTTSATASAKPNWSRDGHWIYFGSVRDAQTHIWKVPLEGGAPRQVTQNTGAEAMESPDGKRLYFQRTNHVNGIWTVPLEGGAEEPVPELAEVGETRNWTVSNEGIYFYAQNGSAASHLIQFFDFATRKVTTVLSPQFPPLSIRPGLDISPDGRRLLYTQVDQKVEGLMMIDGFR